VLDSHAGYTTSCHQRSARNVSFAPRAGGPNKCTTLRASDLPDPRGDDVQMVNTINSTNPIPINTASATGSYSSQCRLSECSILFNAYFSCGGDDRWPRQAILDTGPSPVRWPARLCLRCVDGREWGKSSKPYQPWALQVWGEKLSWNCVKGIPVVFSKFRTTSSAEPENRSDELWRQY
jgi:hypothetical protein